MNVGDLKRRYVEKIGDTVPALDKYIAKLRTAGMISTSGRGLSASDVSYDDALNVVVAINAGSAPARGPELVKAIREAQIVRPLSQALPKGLNARDGTFAEVMRALAVTVPWAPGRVAEMSKDGIVRRPGASGANIRNQLNVSDVLQNLPLTVDFFEDRATVEITLERPGQPLCGIDIEPFRLRYMNDAPLSFGPRRDGIGRVRKSSLNWWLPFVLRHVLEEEA